MTRAQRLILAGLGLAIVCLALALIVAAAWPGETARLQATLAPTLLAPP